MELQLLFQFAIFTMVIAQFIVIIFLFSKNGQGQQERLDKNETNIRNELERKFGQNRTDLTTSISNFTGLVETRMKSMQESLDLGLKGNREEINKSITDFEQKSSKTIEALTRDTREGLEKTRESVDKRLTEIQQGNEKKLDEMRKTVDEKLHDALEKRLGDSFKLVSERLELVQKGLGEMQSLASDVGDLKKVMSNVKTKGVLGEYQLEAILEQLLNPGQYEKNVKTKAGSNDRVEFAIKIPSKADSDRVVWLPIDAKLPTSDYESLLDAYDSGDKKNVEDARKKFSRTVNDFAKKIKELYIDPPNTVDFAIMFLPFEGAYAEVVRDPALFEGIQRDHKIIVTGPSTIAAFLNALQVGFKSLAVEKGTGAILNILSAVKKEFGNFGDILEKVKKQIDSASSTLDETVGKRTKAINKALKNVDVLPDDTVGQGLLDDAASDLDEIG